MACERYDLVVLGSGPAGEKGAVQAAFFDKKVALVEGKMQLGGTCVNTGTVPSKTLRETSLLLSGLRHRDLRALTIAAKKPITITDFLSHEHRVVRHERQRIETNLKKHNVEIIYGKGTILDRNRIEVSNARGEKRVLETEFILIATGSSPRQVEGIPYHDPRVFDSDMILSLKEIPQVLTIFGGGVVGCEFAGIFAEIGVQVTIVERGSNLFEFMDREIVSILESRMESIGIKILKQRTLKSVEVSDFLKVQLDNDLTLYPKMILISSGRIGNSSGLGLENVAINTDARGMIKVNKHHQTSVSNIYAAGDIIGFPALASTSMEQGRISIVHAFSLGYKKEIFPILPIGIYTIPECSMVGVAEHECRPGTYVVGRALYSGNVRGQIVGDKSGMLKLIFSLENESHRLIGAHMIGEMATELIHIAQHGMLSGATIETFIDNCYNHPTMSEMYKYAAYDALGSVNLLKGN